MKSRMFVLGTILAAALPLWAEPARNPRGTVAPDALEPVALAGERQVAPAAGNPREWYFVVVKGPDPDFAAVGATFEAAWRANQTAATAGETIQ